MASESRTQLNGRAVGDTSDIFVKLNENLQKATDNAESHEFHGDDLIADKETKLTGKWNDVANVFTYKNAKQLGTVAWKKLSLQGLDVCHLHK